MLNDAFNGSMYVSGKLTTYPSPKVKEVRVNYRLGEGQVVSFPETYIDPIILTK